MQLGLNDDSKTIYLTDASQLMEVATMAHIARPTVEHDMSIGTNLYDVQLVCDSLANEFDIGRDLWFTQARWTNLVRSYLDPELVTRFVKASREIYNKRGKDGVVTEMQFKSNKRSAKKHKWGNCLLSASYRGQVDSHIKPTLVFHSRVTYMGYISGLDIGLATVLAKYIAGRERLSDIGLIWKIDVSQVHAFKTLPWLYAHRHLLDYVLRLETPTALRIQKWHEMVLRYEKQGKPIDDELYGPLRRVRQIWYNSNNGILRPPSIINDLDFSKLEGLGVEYDM